MVSEDLFGNVTSAQSDATSGGALDTPNPDAPLAVRLRPRTIDEIVGQQHLLTPGSPLRRLAEGRYSRDLHEPTLRGDLGCNGRSQRHPSGT